MAEIGPAGIGENGIREPRIPRRCHVGITVSLNSVKI
jgi:hypothetical protein